MGFGSVLKGFVSGFEKGWKMGGDITAEQERRQARQDALHKDDPRYMTPEQRAEFERTRGRSGLPVTNADGSPATTGSTGGGSFDEPQLNAAAKAIRTIESGSAAGNYGAVGGRTAKGNRAYGAYQVMDFNIPAWTEKHFGQQLTPDEFLKNRAAQDAVFKGEFGSYMQKYGPEGASRAWFGGPGAVAASASGRQDINKTSVGGYGSKFSKLYATHLGDAPSVAGAQTDVGSGAQPTSQSGAVTTTAPPATSDTPISQDAEPAGAAGGLGEAARGVNPLLLRVANRALQDNPGLFAVNPETKQVRTPADQDEYVKKGWSKTNQSYHLAGNALDVVPINPQTGKPDPNYKEGYQKIQGAMRSAAQQLGVKNLGWGGDWKSFKDLPHWELTGTSRSYTPPSTTAARTTKTASRADATDYPVTVPAGGKISDTRAKSAAFTGAIPAPAVAPGAPAPVLLADASDVLAQPPNEDDEEAPMARQPTTFARRGGAIPAPASYRRGGPVQRFITGGAPKTAATFGKGANADAPDYYEWLEENIRRRAAEEEEVARPTAFRERPVYVGSMSTDKFTPEGAVSRSGRPYMGTGINNNERPLTAVYQSGYNPAGTTMPGGGIKTAEQINKERRAYFNQVTANDEDDVLRAQAAQANATQQQQPWLPWWQRGPGYAGGNGASPQTGGGSGGGAPQTGGGQWGAMGVDVNNMGAGGGGAPKAAGAGTGGATSAKNINDVGKTPWNPGMSIENAIAVPWLKQRQWEQFGGPGANVGMNMSGTHPAAYGAGHYYGPGLYGEEGGPVPDADEREQMAQEPYYYEGGAIPDGTLAYYHGGTVRYFQGGPVGGPVQRFEGGGAATSAMDEARERIMMRNGAYRQGLTAGDLARARSDPSRYGPYYPEREQTRTAPAKPAPVKAKPGAGTKKEPKKDVTTTGGTGRDDRFEHYKPEDTTYPRNVDPDRMERDDGPIGPPAPTTPTPANPALQATPDTPVTAMGDRAFGDTSVLPFDPARNPYDTQRGETPVSRRQAIPAPQNLRPRRGISSPAGEYPQANPMAGAEAGQEPGPPPATVGIMSTMAPMRARIDASRAAPPPAPVPQGPRPSRPPIGTPMVDPATGLPIDPRTGQPIQPRAPGLARGGTVPRYQDGGAMLTEEDLLRQQSDPTRYGAEPGMPPPQAAPPPMPRGGIPTPGGAPAAVAPAAAVAQPQAAASPASQARPRPEGDSGYYQKPSKQEIAELNRIGLDEIQRMISGQSQDQRQDGRPAIGPDPRAQVAQNAYGSNALAPSTQEMQEAYRASDPEGKLSTDELQLKTMQDMHDFWLSQGNSQKAATAAAHVLLYGKKVASTSGAMALSAAEDGNLLQAAQWLSKGYAHIANGESVKFEQDPKDPTKITYWKVDSEGQYVIEPTTVGQREIANMATAMANGSGWLQDTVTAARGGSRGSGRSAAPKGPGYEERSREENRAALAGLSAAGDELEKARESGDAAAIKAAETKFRTEYRKTLTTPSLGASAKPIAEQYMPDVIPKPAEKLSDTEQKEQREKERQEKELADAQQKVDAEQDPVKKKALQADLNFIPINRQYDSAVSTIKRAVPTGEINKTIPPELKDPDQRTWMRSAIEGIMRANNVTPTTAYEFLRAATNPQGQAPRLQNGRLMVPGFGGILINREIFDLMHGINKGRSRAGGDLPAAVQVAPHEKLEEEPVEEE
jgi:hypothetical protein